MEAAPNVLNIIGSNFQTRTYYHVSLERTKATTLSQLYAKA